jgi:hypothetical protein
MKPFITICSLLLLMASCHSSTEEPFPPEPPIGPPVEEGTPLLLAPDDLVTITVADETFTVDFLRSNDIQAMYDWILTGILKETREAYIDRYKIKNNYIIGAYDAAKGSEAEFVQLEYALAQECFSDRCDSELRKEILQLVVDKQKPKYETPYVYYSYAIHSGVFLMAVILVKERAYSAEYIDSGTLQEALLFLNDFDYFTEGPVGYGSDFSDLIVDCAQKFLTDNK